MSKYRIVTNGKKFRVQERGFLCWWTLGDLAGYRDYDSREDAEAKIRERIAVEQSESLPWRVVE